MESIIDVILQNYMKISDNFHLSVGVTKGYTFWAIFYRNLLIFNTNYVLIPQKV